jgi:hypothetical protein
VAAVPGLAADGSPAAHGEEFAAWIHDKPMAKAAVKALMDQAIKKYEAEMPKVAE